MNTVSATSLENTRKDAAKIQSEVLQRVAAITQTKIAEQLGVSVSTVSRAVSDDLYRVCEILAACGLQLAPIDAVVTTQEELDALKRWAIRYLQADLNREKS